MEFVSLRYSVRDLPSKTEQMLHFIPDVILEEEVFSSRNLGPDCSTIGDLLYDYGEKFILYVYRCWGGDVSLEEITAAMKICLPVGR